MTRLRHPLAITTLTATIAAVPAMALAQVYKCKAADGGTSYQSSPCPNAKPPAAAPVAAPAPVPARSREPYDDPYAPQNADKRPTLTPPPMAANRERSAAPSPAPAARTSPLTDKERLAQYEHDRSAQALDMQVARMKAQEKARECGVARQQLGVNKEQRPIYSYDAKGNRVYVEDKDRAQSLARAQQRADDACN